MPVETLPPPTAAKAPQEPPARPTLPPPTPAKTSKVGLVLTLLIVVAVVGAGVYFILPRIKNRQATAAGGKGDMQNRPIPVVAQPAATGDLPIYINALGTVTPFNTATIRSRVDGELMKVAFVEGQTVKQGDLLAEVDARPYEAQLMQAEGQLMRDQAFLKNAQADVERYQSAGNSVTQQQLDTAQATVKQYEGIVRSDQAQIDTAKLQLTYAKITAPISGRIGLRLVDQGNIIHATDQTGIAVITQLQPISVVFSIPQDQIAQVVEARANGEKLVVEAFDRDLQNKLADGVLDALDNQVDASTGTVKLKATFENEKGTLFPNQFVNVRLLVKMLHNAVLVPAAAIQRGPDNTFVYAIKPNDKGEMTAEVRQVTTGPTEAERTVVTAGVLPGDMLVTDGVDKLVDGSPVSTRQRGQGGTTRPSGDSAGGQRRNRQSGGTTRPVDVQ